MKGWLSAADIFVHPSHWEGMPNSLMEAMSVGLPSIATNIDGILEIAQDGYNAVLTEPQNSEKLAEKILLLANDSDLRSTISKNAKEFVLENCGIDKMIKLYEASYREIINKKTKGE
jgi:glycosyltransferase involved in cell wall biosynthesis